MDNRIEKFIVRHSGNGSKRFTVGMLLIFLMFWLICGGAWALETPKTLPQVHGTLRGKYELQTEEMEQRFEVRTARLSVTGELTEAVSYKAEIDLCDEGKIKMLDAYTRLNLREFLGIEGKGLLNFQIGQMRVPFTIDAHRSPHQQYFANRSFIAKQVGNVRDVGAQIGWSFNAGVPVTVAAGLFNGSGLTEQQDYWTRSINFSAKAQVALSKGFNIVVSAQKIKPNDVNVMMYDGGVFYHKSGWHIEGEYLFKHYARGMFEDVHAVDAFASYDIKCGQKSPIRYVTPLVRYDFMTDHSDGKINDSGTTFKLTDHKRSRLTSGVTLSLNKPFVTDIRINYEKYFYRHVAQPKPSERDKTVIEFMTRFISVH